MKILMVCLGNICRSPMAQGVMEKCIEENQLNWSVDSAGTNGYHNGEHPDQRATLEAKKQNIDISKQISRPVKPSDLDEFDLIFAMDSNNYSYLKSMCKYAHQVSKIHLLMEFAFPGRNTAVPDPYYDNSFHNAFQLIHKGCEAVIDKFQREISKSR